MMRLSLRKDSTLLQRERFRRSSDRPPFSASPETCMKSRTRNMKLEIVGTRLSLIVVVLALTATGSAQQISPLVNPVVTGKGTVGNIPMWDTTSDIINSVMFQKSLGIGIGTIVPAATLDVNGKGDIRDTLTLFPKSTDNTLAVNGSAFKIGNTGLVTFITGQTFPGTGTITGITTAAGSGLTGGVTTGTASLSLLKTCLKGQTLEWSGTAWACATPSGSGTITGVTAGTGLTGGGASGTVTLSVAAKACAAGQALTALPFTCAGFATTGANTFTANQTVMGEVNIAGSLRAEDASFTTDVAAKDLTVSGGVTGATATFSGAATTGALTVNGNITAKGSTSVITGVEGTFAASNATQVLNVTQSGSGDGIMVTSTSGDAISGDSTSAGVGVTGSSTGALGIGVWGISSGARGVQGNSDTLGGVVGLSDSGTGVAGVGCASCTGAAGIFGKGKDAGLFSGSVGVTGDLSVTGVKAFHIDHPLDPSNKYLNHFAIESNEVLNTYSGNVATDGTGTALVRLPDYFEALNTNYRYQLTVLGQFAQAIILQEIQNNIFVIKTDKPSVKVSWQVTGVRSDAYVKAHPMAVEEEKPVMERGYYLAPEVFGQQEERSISWLYHGGLMRDSKALEAKRKAQGLAAQ